LFPSGFLNGDDILNLGWAETAAFDHQPVK
jgi:hypothetical protein